MIGPKESVEMFPRPKDYVGGSGPRHRHVGLDLAAAFSVFACVMQIVWLQASTGVLNEMVYSGRQRS